MSTRQHELARKVLSLIRRQKESDTPLTYTTVAIKFGLTKKSARAIAQVCDLLDAASALANTPMLALVKVRSSNGEINPKAWVKHTPEGVRDKIIKRSLAHTFTDNDYTAIEQALQELSGLGNRSAWAEVKNRVPENIFYQQLTTDTTFQVQDAINDLGTDKNFWNIIERYYKEGTVFQSPHQGALYCVESLEKESCTVARLSANESAMISINTYRNKHKMISDAAGELTFSSLDNTVAIRNTILQAFPFVLSSDRNKIIDVTGSDKAVDVFIEYIKKLDVDRSRGKPKLYKPAMILCVINGIESGELKENKITFDWIAPKFIEKMEDLGEEASERMAAMFFFHLTRELFWMLCYKNPQDRVHDGREGPSAIRNKVNHAILKDTFWKMLQDASNRSRIEIALTNHWFAETAKINRNVWWVNQGQTYDKEKPAGYLWAPQSNDKGQTFAHWESMTKVKKDDIVINYANRAIVSMSIAKSKAIEYENELDEKLWHKKGWKVDLDYHDLSMPIALEEIRGLMSSIKSTIEKNGPFNTVDGINQGYLFNFSLKGLKDIVENFEERIPKEILKIFSKKERSYWIFQCNPEKFNINMVLEEGRECSWVVTRYKDDIKEGDLGFLWVSGEKAGIIAGFEVLSPSSKEINETDPTGWISGEEEKSQERCLIKIIDIYEEISVTRTKLQKTNFGKNLSIIKNPQGTNFKISKDEYVKIDDMLKGLWPRYSTVIPLNQILYGPPGTGKTYSTKKIAVGIIELENIS